MPEYATMFTFDLIKKMIRFPKMLDLIILENLIEMINAMSNLINRMSTLLSIAFQ